MNKLGFGKAMVSVVVAAGLLTGVAPAMAMDMNGKWVAASTTAMSITGDIEVSADKIVFETGASLGLKPVEGEAHLFTLASATDNPVLLNGNTLCGSNAPPEYIAFAMYETSMILLAFDGPDVPKLNPDPLDQDGICASFTYER
ncbi:hypothetical protein [Bauldia litoralis]|uniref:Uncharacterized protein n=1 Tax=Bauldia litoralis TaxID=665467 RepID=A0A1G6CGF2_9HYPH|nr:hypothetical protein [Bauldia litoralis]SDB31984.1 hypothetical protein SAMN02982931_02472 [Bauldia litoralis]